MTLLSGGEVRVDMTYRLSEAFDGYGRLGDDDTRTPIPIEQRAFERDAARIDGMRMLRYSDRTSGSQRVIRTELAFDSLDAFSRWYGAELRYQEGEGLTMPLARAIATSDPSPLSVIEQDLLSAYTVTLGVTLPEDIDRVNLGSVDSGTARLTLPLHEFLAPSADITWEIGL